VKTGDTRSIRWGGTRLRTPGMLPRQKELTNYTSRRVEVKELARPPENALTYGPVFAYRSWDRVVAFAHGQVGAIHGRQGYLGISQNAFKFASACVGGADVDINRRIAVRAQLDCPLTRFLGLNQKNLQTSVGLDYRFGCK